MAASTKTNPKTVVDSAAKALEDATIKAQEQYFSILEQSQSAALEGYETIIDAVSKLDVPAVPGLDAVVPGLDAMKVPTDAFDGLFDFTAKVLENQREFAHKLLAVNVKA